MGSPQPLPLLLCRSRAAAVAAPRQSLRQSASLCMQMQPLATAEKV